MSHTMYGESRGPRGRPRAGFWARRSRRGKLLIMAIVVVTAALAVGLGVGLGVGLNDPDGNSQEQKKAAPLEPTRANAGIWQPQVHASWQIVLPQAIKLHQNATKVEPDVDVFDLDLFLTDKSIIDTLHRLDKRVMCYFSAGSYEPDRPDSKFFLKKDKGHELSGWPGERWLNLRSNSVRSIMQKRLALAKDKGCDGVDPDNVDAYANKNGLGMTTDDSIDFLRWFTSIAQSNKLAVGLKNAAMILPQVLPAVQFVVQEQCVQFAECAKFAPAINVGKPVFHIEYPQQVKKDTASQFCGDSGTAAGAAGFSTILKKNNLDGWIENCSGVQATTPTQS